MMALARDRKRMIRATWTLARAAEAVSKLKVPVAQRNLGFHHIDSRWRKVGRRRTRQQTPRVSRFDRFEQAA